MPFTVQRIRTNAEGVGVGWGVGVRIQPPDLQNGKSVTDFAQRNCVCDFVRRS